MAIVVGVAALIAGNGFVNGIDENLIRVQEEAVVGDVLLRPNDYPVDGRNFPLNKIQIPPSELKRVLESDNIPWTDRLFFRARLIHETDSMQIKAIGYNPERRASVFDIPTWEVDGSWPQKPDEIALGTGLAALLTLEPGTRIFLETRSQQGAINAMQYTISGIVDSHNAALNAFTLWMPLSTAETLLQIQGERSHVSLRIDSREQAAVWKEKLQIPNWKASTAIDEIEDLLHLNRIRRRALHFLSLILMAIAATGIANTILMATYERIPELGTLRALGFQRVQIALLLLFEGMSMGLIAGLVGVAIGSAINLYLHRYGIDLSTQSAA
ncbi:MAG: FtsX-like permease family protein, partial [Myxococcota bacterium]|nr:FtsX-like permease family protein [Myxococcota bacterium]